MSILDIVSNIRHQDFHACVRASSAVTLRLPPLDSETGWTGELWSKTNLLIWQNYDKTFFCAAKKKLQKMK